MGQLRGVLAGLPVADLCHDIPLGDVKAAAYVLWVSWRYFPEGTVFLVVVDPGVGSARKVMAARWRGHFFVAPDNGVLSPFMDEGFEAWEIPVPPEASATFHGRDVMAPAAKLLHLRGSPDPSWKPLGEPVKCQVFSARETGYGIRGRVIFVDRFGNLITDIPGEMLQGKEWQVVRKGVVIRPARTYSDVEPGEPLALIGSGGFLEISVREGSAAEALGLGRGNVVEVVWTQGK